MAFRHLRDLFFSTCLVWAMPCSASPILLDQSYVPTSVPPNGLLAEDTQTVAQTFTVGRGGLLSAIELDLACCAGATGVTFPAEDLLIEIRTTLPNGLPSNDVLFATRAQSRDLSIGSFAFERFPLGSRKFPVVPGELLAIVLSSTAPPLGLFNPYTWHGDAPGGYTGGLVYVDRGGGFLETGFDVGFKTQVPEPAVLVLFAVGAAAVTGVRTVRSRRGLRGSSAAR